MKNISLFFVLAIVSLFLVTNAVATNWQEDTADISEMTLYVNGNVVWYGYCAQYSEGYDCFTNQYAIPALERSDDMTIRAVLTSNNDLDKVEIKTWINGYRNDIKDKTSEFDVFSGKQYSKTLFLEIPDDIEAKDTYTLHVKVSGKTELTGVDEVKLETSVQRNTDLLEILSIDLYNKDDTGFRFTTGSTLYADVVVKNRGNHIAKDVYVKLSIPEENLERTVYLGDIGTHDNQYQDTIKKTVALPLPLEDGTYTLKVEAYNREIDTDETSVIVLEYENGKNIRVLPQTTKAVVKQGQTAKYNLVVVNLGENTESFTIETIGTEGWSTQEINAVSFYLDSGESKIVELNLNVNADATTGEHPFIVKVRYGDKADQFDFSANVEKSGINSANWKVTLMVIAIILAIVIIVLLAIMLGKQRTGEEEQPEEAQEAENYY